MEKLYKSIYLQEITLEFLTLSSTGCLLIYNRFSNIQKCTRYTKGVYTNIKVNK